MALGSAQIDHNKLAPLIVRVTTPDGTMGTGFFVAPGIVLTAAHVVQHHNLVSISTHQSLSAAIIPAGVEAKSELATEGGLWPYPDLAIVRLQQEIDHSCVWLDNGSNLTEHEPLSTWGFSVRDEELVPIGSPASFEHEGREGDGYIKLKSGQARPGLSGAPLISRSRRSVVGIMTATRDRGSALGGWATSTDALTDGRGLQTLNANDIKGLIEEIWTGNRRSILADRAVWHDIFPFDSVPRQLEQPWDTFQDDPMSKPSDILLCEYGVVPYLFRENEIDEMLTWCLNDEAMAIAWVADPGGSGKTRYAIEICKRLSNKGWLTGFLPTRDIDDYVNEAIYHLLMPKFVVIDYSEAESPRKIHGLLMDLHSQASLLAPVRVLMLSRIEHDDRKNKLMNDLRRAKPPLRRIIDRSMNRPRATLALTIDQRVELYEKGILSFASACTSHAKRSRPPLQTPDLQSDQYQEPLNVLFEAFSYVMASEPTATADNSPTISRIIEHEQKYWDLSAPPESLSSTNRLCVAMATIAGAESFEEAELLVAACAPELRGDNYLRERRATVEWLHSLLPGPNYLNPLRPDKLGEALVAHVIYEELEEYGDVNFHKSKILENVFNILAPGQKSRCLTVLTRIFAYDDIFANLVLRSIPEFSQYMIRDIEADSTVVDSEFADSSTAEAQAEFEEEEEF